MQLKLLPSPVMQPLLTQSFLWPGTQLCQPGPQAQLWQELE